MDNREVNIFLKNLAIQNGLCEQWQNDWTLDKSNTELLEMFIKGQDFCIANNYPSKEFIKENFDIDFRRKNGVLVDDKYSLSNKRHIILMGNSTSNIRYNMWNVGAVYLRHDSVAVITAKNNSFVMVHLHDNATVSVAASDKAKIVVIRASSACAIKQTIGNVVVKDNPDYLKK